MKKRYLLIALLVLTYLLAIPAMAATNNGPVNVAGNTYYDTSAGQFLYYVNSRAVRSNVADGMITEQAVTVKADAGVALAVYLNGSRLDNLSGGTFTTPGEYVVMHMGGTVSERIFTFTIVPKLCNYVTSFAMPLGFEITEATLNGVTVPFDRDYIKLTEEGTYSVRYRCLKTNLSYQLVLQTDFTGPTLSLENVKDGAARGPVDISDAKNAASVNIYHDGEKISRKDVLTESGEYYIELADEAGNKTIYYFTILVYFDANSWLFFALVMLSAVGTIIYLMHSRRHLRVR